MDYHTSNLDLIGNTPLLRITEDDTMSGPLILAKLEYFNPGGSVKDRIARFVIEKAMKEGKLKKGDTIIDNTSGNTGIGIAVVAQRAGVRPVHRGAILRMYPSDERIVRRAELLGL